MVVVEIVLRLFEEFLLRPFLEPLFRIRSCSSEKVFRYGKNRHLKNKKLKMQSK